MTPLLIPSSLCFVEGGFAPVLSGLPAGVPAGHPASGTSGAVPPTSVAGGVASVNSAIQKIAQRYCGDCKVGNEGVLDSDKKASCLEPMTLSHT